MILELKDREIYDNFSLNLIKLDAFSLLIKTILLMPIERKNYPSTARIFELCACHPEGIQVL